MADKVTMAEFEKRLDDNRYDTLTGARRGIGKMAGWSEKERALANEKADAHFAKAGGGAPPKAKKGPKKAATKTPKQPKARAQQAAPVEPKTRRKAVQLDLPLADELAKTHASIQKSEALKCILENAARTKELGGPDADIRKVAAAASKDLIESIYALVGTIDNTKSAGDNGSTKVDTSVADAALTAAAEAAKRAAAKPMAIPPLMGRQG